MTAVALVCRFYGFSLQEVMNFTVRQFTILLREIGKILSMESGSGSSQPRVLTGEIAHKTAMRMFGKGKR